MERRPLLSLVNVCRYFQAGTDSVAVLKDINLTLYAGEMVAIMGPSGSGKSTLMNILGCLDQPSSGRYCIDGQDVAQLNSDARAQLRRERLGFIFQRYHLIPSLTVLENVAVPAIYAHIGRTERHARARHLLQLLGLSRFAGQNVTQLSGGQQQRVSIGRALMNGGDIILADEPTGALDSQNGQDVLLHLQALHRQGHTVILITHDPRIARYAGRIIQLEDGAIIADTRNEAVHPVSAAVPDMPPRLKPAQYAWLSSWQDAVWSAWHSLSAHRLRTCLTLLGIVIGIASVVSLNAAGEGARQYVLSNLNTLGSNVMTVYPGREIGDDRAAGIRSLVRRDLAALATLPGVKQVSPAITTSLRIRWQRVDTNAAVNGVSDSALRLNNLALVSGRGLLPQDIERQSQVVVIDDNLRKKLFAPTVSPVGQVIIVGMLPCVVVGVVRSQSLFSDNVLSLWMPWTTAGYRLLGQSWFNTIAVHLDDQASTASVEKAIQHVLTRLHGRQDFYVRNSDAFAQSLSKTSFALTLFLSLIALVSLVVGGIGVMNIMLVCVVERTKETGIRMAVGARQRDIRRQFLTEAIIVCLVGSLVGIVLSFALGWGLSLFTRQWRMIFSMQTLLIAVSCAVIVGLLSGWLPARNAARLDPAQALTRE
ncbi:MacB family efflux pump subunit [Pseudomonas helleri]|uniref:MacB family efflux pump subunit n=1 Tax=Pseudomonas helleri TaxID=1608996 RepID=UPI0021CA0F1B|nr:MacB family efflux pump subunit [Pseudomonas helleri]MCU1754742.1 MacB family efflux pump subunit [Pseudomonas helleri]